MKLLNLLVLCFALNSSGISQEKQNSKNNISPQILTGSDWQFDLKFLQETVHKDFSFLFKNVTSKDFDAAVDKLYKEIPSMQDYERLAGIGRIISLFKYGHTDISWRESPVKYHMTPINFYWFSDGIYVEGADKKYDQIIGAKLIKVENVQVEKALENLRPLLPAENDQYFKAYVLDFLTIPQALHAQRITNELKKSITYTFEKEGKTFDVTIESKDAFRFPRKYGFVTPGADWISARDQSGTPHYLKNLEKIYYYEYLPEFKTVYIRHSQIQDEPQENIPAFYKSVFKFIEQNDVEKLVLDVRLNGGGNNYKNKPIVTGIIESAKINKPGKLFVIIGRRTFSACQNLVNELSNYTNAMFVGEPTSENINFYGDTRRIELPRTKLPVFLSFAWWQDKPQWENAPWLAPQLAVTMSFQEYMKNIDPVLDVCLNFSDENVILDPFGYIRDLFMAGKLDQVESEAKKIAADPRYRYMNFESKLDKAGYDLLNSSQVGSALHVFGLNTRLYPKSANVWNSFAQANYKSGQLEKAKEYFSKAIELDPTGIVADNAREKLKQISK